MSVTASKPAREATDAVDGGAAPAPAARPRFRPARGRKIGRLVVFGLVVVAAVALVALRFRPKVVSVTPVVRGVAIDAVYATATVEASDRVTVKAKVAGSILALKVREGDAVKKGDLLAVVDSPALKFQLERGKADQWAASQQASVASPQLAAVEAQSRMTEATLKNAREERERLQRLVAASAAPPSELDRATNNVAMLEAQLASQRAQLQSLRIDLSARSSGTNAAVSELSARLADAEVRAPIDGVVLTRTVELGELVPVNGPLFKLGDVKRLVLECAVDESDIGRISVGKKAAVSLYAFPKQAFDGTVYEILPDADRTKKSFLVRVRLAAPPAGLRSGMSAEVNVIVDEHPNALLAPAEAVDATSAVWVLSGDRVQKRTLEIGVRDLLRVEVLSGLADGDSVVVAGVEGLAEGARVKATTVVANPTAPMPKSSRGGGSL